jgi:hypothetical protein
MKIHVALLITAICAVEVMSGGQRNGIGSPTQNIVGAWKLIEYEDHLAGGTVEYPFGKNPVGLLIYDDSGHMAVQIMKVPHPRVASGDEEKVAPEEKGALFDSYVAYFGKYTVDWTRKIITHKVEADLYDVYVGTSQERPFELKDDRLTFSPQWERDGKPVRGIRAFERIRK